MSTTNSGEPERAEAVSPAGREEKGEEEVRREFEDLCEMLRIVEEGMRGADNGPVASGSRVMLESEGEGQWEWDWGEEEEDVKLDMELDAVMWELFETYFAQKEGLVESEGEVVEGKVCLYMCALVAVC
ncbi:hypothetical protein A0H81_07753 [Grifola frondosa]|uniref:Uncharacterized protein n=1 Tax=Grifola frondosa TaxID=5627 RepID=A0A1C7M5W9_GRIFR|nr:hypothetical protein A0H81_07753 [Grifola frondosa]